MADFGLTFDKKSGGFDLAKPPESTAPGDFMADGLRTAVLASLLTWGRADTSDDMPDFSGDLKGWWGDGYPKSDGDKIGGRLWLYARSVLTPEIMEKARLDGEACLAWMIDDGLATRVRAQASRATPTGLQLDITIDRPDGTLFQMTVDHF